jgi:hypothetical protein
LANLKDLTEEQTNLLIDPKSWVGDMQEIKTMKVGSSEEKQVSSFINNPGNKGKLFALIS